MAAANIRQPCSLGDSVSLSAIERAIVTALVSAIVKELRTEESQASVGCGMIVKLPTH